MKQQRQIKRKRNVNKLKTTIAFLLILLVAGIWFATGIAIGLKLAFEYKELILIKKCMEVCEMIKGMGVIF